MTLRGIVVLISTFAMAGWLQAQSPITISVDTKHPEAAISSDFSGLSFELSQLLPDENGVHYFRPDNRALINLFQTLGIKSLRVGGNTADRNIRELPSRADIDSLFGFAKTAGVKVIYCLRLHNGDPAQDADTAKYIMDHYADQLDCFSIGQEPNLYPKVTNSMGVVTPRPPYPVFAKQWKQFENVIEATVPNAKFCGPGVDDTPVWEQQFMDDFGRGYHVALITTHLYPGRSGEKVPTPEIGRDRMLSSDFINTYQKLYDGFVPAVQADGLPYRLEEANNYFNGGATNVSDTFASALWGLDFMYWWAEHGAAGLNFHTGDKVAAGAEMRASRYTAYISTDDGLMVRPLGYGIKAFDIGGHGTMVPATVSNPQNLNMSVYAVQGDDKNIYVTIINKEHGEHARDGEISLVAPSYQTGAKMIRLCIPNGDVTAKSGATLGGSEINSDGSWNGKWTDLSSANSALFNIRIPAGSAGIVELSQDYLSGISQQFSARTQAH
jgi:hypothetical protein